MWSCPKCGPVSDALYGDDEVFHCSSLECDRVVEILTPEERFIPKKTHREYSKGLTEA